MPGSSGSHASKTTKRGAAGFKMVKREQTWASPPTPSQPSASDPLNFLLSRSPIAPPRKIRAVCTPRAWAYRGLKSKAPLLAKDARNGAPRSKFDAYLNLSQRFAEFSLPQSPIVDPNQARPLRKMGAVSTPRAGAHRELGPKAPLLAKNARNGAPSRDSANSQPALRRIFSSHHVQSLIRTSPTSPDA
jgi:hypothetical protein